MINQLEIDLKITTPLDMDKFWQAAATARQGKRARRIIDVLRARYHHDGSLKAGLQEIGQEFGVTGTRAGQLVNTALRRMRHPDMLAQYTTTSARSVWQTTSLGNDLAVALLQFPDYGLRVACNRNGQCSWSLLPKERLQAYVNVKPASMEAMLAQMQTTALKDLRAALRQQLRAVEDALVAG